MIEIIGPNGCGKTSLLKLIAGLSQPAQGTIYFSPFFKKPLYLSVRSGFDEELTAYENLQYLLALERQKCPSLSNILERMGIISFKDQLLRQLSSGEKQRLSLTRLLLLNRPCWLLDEPLTSLDHEGEEIFKGICKEHQNRGGIILIASPKPLSLGKTLSLKDYDRSFVSSSNSWEAL